MARQGKGILGAPSKSVGMITGQKHSGKDTIRSKPKPSIKTQTQALIKTKSNFQIAQELYAKTLLTVAGNLTPKQPGNMSIQNHFISEILKLTSIKESGTYRFNPLPPTYTNFRWKTRNRLQHNTTRVYIDWGFLPYPELSFPSDLRWRITINSYTDSNSSFVNHPSFNRGWGRQTLITDMPTNPGYKSIVGMVFISADYKYISNGIANIVFK